MGKREIFPSIEWPEADPKGKQEQVLVAANVKFCKIATEALQVIADSWQISLPRLDLLMSPPPFPV